MSPGKPMLCSPLPLMALLNGSDPSVNRAIDGLPLASDVAVCVPERAFIVLVTPPSSSPARVAPVGLENCSVPPTCRSNWLTPEPGPPENATPNTSHFANECAPLPHG